MGNCTECRAHTTGVRLPPGGGKGTPERQPRPARTNRRSFTAGGRKRNARTATSARPHKPAFVYRWGAEKERRLDRAGRGGGSVARRRRQGVLVAPRR